MLYLMSEGAMRVRPCSADLFLVPNGAGRLLKRLALIRRAAAEPGWTTTAVIASACVFWAMIGRLRWFLICVVDARTAVHASQYMARTRLVCSCSHTSRLRTNARKTGRILTLGAWFVGRAGVCCVSESKVVLASACQRSAVAGQRQVGPEWHSVGAWDSGCHPTCVASYVHAHVVCNFGWLRPQAFPVSAAAFAMT